VEVLSTCDTDTGGTCLIANCGSWRGKTFCSDYYHSCMCEEGLCANNGKCVEPTFNHTQRGKLLLPVVMHDNDHLKRHEPPQWSTSVTVKVVSSDGRKRMSYMITIKQIVSDFSELHNLTANVCKLEPAFAPNVTDYYCTWWWEDEKGNEVTSANFTPHLNETCRDCEVRMTHPERYKESHISLSFQSAHQQHWQKFSAPWLPRPWSREFLYGEMHSVPVTVVSANMITHSVYNVHMYRDCPWYMKVAFTRSVSQVASTLAVIMAVSMACIGLLGLCRRGPFEPICGDFAAGE